MGWARSVWGGGRGPPPLNIKKSVEGKEGEAGKGKLGGNVIGWVLRDSGLADAAIMAWRKRTFMRLRGQK